MKNLSQVTLTATILLALFTPAYAASSQAYLATPSSVDFFDLTTGAIAASVPIKCAGGFTSIVADTVGKYVYLPCSNLQGAASLVYQVSVSTKKLKNLLPAGTAYPTNVVVSPDGTTVYAFYPTFGYNVAIFNATTGALSGQITFNNASTLLGGVAVSTDGAKVFVSVENAPIVPRPVPPALQFSPTVPIGNCPILNGICIFDTSTLALLGTVTPPATQLSVSPDGTTLIAVDDPVIVNVPYSLNFVNISTLVVTPGILPASFQIAHQTIFAKGAAFGLLTGVNSDGSGSRAYSISTINDKVGGQFPTPTNYNGNGDTAAISLDGQSVYFLNGKVLTQQSLSTGSVLQNYSLTDGAVAFALGPIN